MEDLDTEEKKEKELYSWEKEYERSWDLLTEDERGLRSLLAERKRKKKREEQLAAVRRGLTRHVFLIIDFSKSLFLTDWKPSRHIHTQKAVESFILNYFDQNPLSQMGIIISRNSVAEKLTELSANASKHLTAIQQAFTNTTAEGEFSMQNSLEVARSSLR
jgi:transcription initiation factor TFIIH subunit 2